jgi:two-component system, cell cycle response regulator DivK
MYAEFLSYKGFEVIQAQNGVQALAQAASLVPDFIILDLALPDIDGIEVTRKLKEAAQTASIPIVMLTANAQPRMLEAARKAGCEAVLVKPCTPEELLEIVQGFTNVRTA